MSGCSFYPVDCDNNWTTPGVLFPTPAPALPCRELDMSVNLIQGRGSHLTCALLHAWVLPYINRVWSKAGIYIHMKACRVEKVATPPLVIPGINPDDEELLFNRRVLTDLKAHINVFIVPRMTDRTLIQTQVTGYTLKIGEGPNYDGQAYIVMAELVPERVNLFRFANTLAHEIGHLLGLDHNTTNPGYLMTAYTGSRHDPAPGQEEGLAGWEITRVRAFVLNNRFKPWDFSRIVAVPPETIIIDRRNRKKTCCK